MSTWDAHVSYTHLPGGPPLLTKAHPEALDKRLVLEAITIAAYLAVSALLRIFDHPDLTAAVNKGADVLLLETATRLDPAPTTVAKVPPAARRRTAPKKRKR